jgi:hypothetical protein
MDLLPLSGNNNGMKVFHQHIHGGSRRSPRVRLGTDLVLYVKALGARGSGGVTKREVVVTGVVLGRSIKKRAE